LRTYIPDCKCLIPTHKTQLEPYIIIIIIIGIGLFERGDDENKLTTEKMG